MERQAPLTMEHMVFEMPNVYIFVDVPILSESMLHWFPNLPFVHLTIIVLE